MFVCSLMYRTTDDVNLSVLRCYLLIRHYYAAIMWSAGIKPAEPHCTLKTIQIMREIIESPVHNADGSGAMLVIRIPSVELANLAFENLKNTRDRLVYTVCVGGGVGTGDGKSTGGGKREGGKGDSQGAWREPREIAKTLAIFRNRKSAKRWERTGSGNFRPPLLYILQL